MSAALAAVVRYEVAANAVTALSKQIGEALEACPISQQLLGEYDDALFKSLTDGLRTKTHLYHEFKDRVPCDSGYGDRRLDDDEIEDHLSDDRDGCPECLRAFRLINERKAARKQFGIAKRAIRTIGKAELKRKAIAPGCGDGVSS